MNLVCLKKNPQQKNIFNKNPENVKVKIVIALLFSKSFTYTDTIFAL